MCACALVYMSTYVHCVYMYMRVCVFMCMCMCMCVSECVVLQGSGSWVQPICATFQQADMETCEAVSDKDEVGVEQCMEEGLMSITL